MFNIPYETRKQVYDKALETFGPATQSTVALEELAEAQKEICKMLRGQGNLDHLAEEVADATIMLEQIRVLYDINDRVCEYMDEKVSRLLGLIRTEEAKKEG